MAAVAVATAVAVLRHGLSSARRQPHLRGGQLILLWCGRFR